MTMKELEPEEMPDVVERWLPCGDGVSGIGYSPDRADHDLRTAILAHFTCCSICRLASRTMDGDDGDGGDE